MLIGRRALLNYGQSMSDRKHDKYLRISHQVRSPIRSANNHSNSMLCIMNQAYQKIAIQYDRNKICTIHTLIKTQPNQPLYRYRGLILTFCLCPIMNESSTLITNLL